MFTNWLTSTLSSDIPRPLNLLNTQPDVMLQVGPSHGTRYMAHSAILAMHSGYLRSAIRLDENGIPNTTLPIFLSNIMPEQFSPLFIYMYTGYLDLDAENVFGVSLASHVLHMPQALEICRNYLSRAQSTGIISQNFVVHFAENGANNKILSSSGVKIIRPIASKPSISNIGFAVPPIPYVPLARNDTPFHTISNECFIKPVVSGTESNSVGQKNNLTSMNSANYKALNSSPINLANEFPNISNENSPTEKLKKTLNYKIDATAQKDCESDRKIIIDVATCDGPVKFQRILNDAYGQLVNRENQTNLGHSQKKLSSFHQQMAKNIRQKHINKSNNLVPKIRKPSSGDLFNCVYCKHSFKSQYCYQKHAKRHLNPVMLSTLSTETVLNVKQIPKTLKDVQREVRQLDMNVQYYPCKKCGSKFPSYYFVHKHKKLCHNKQESIQ